MYRLNHAILLAFAATSVVGHAETLGNFVSTTPCRLIDTRESFRGSLGSPYLNAKVQRDFSVLDATCGIPRNVLAYALNVTVIPHGSLSYLTVWPTGQVIPTASTLNSPSGTVVANGAIIPAGNNGSISVFGTADTDLIIDISGYFAPQSTAAIDQVGTQVTSLGQQVTQLQTQAAQAVQVGQQVAQLQAEQAQLVQLPQQMSQLRTQVGQAASTGQVASLEQQVAQLQAQVAQVTQLGQQVTQLQAQLAQIASTTTQVADLTQHSSQTDQTLAQLQGQVSGLSSSASQVTQALSAVSSLNSAVKIDGVKQGVAIGTDASLGTQDTSFGYEALLQNTTGNANTAIGMQALLGNTAGTGNVGVGVGSLNTNSSGNRNIALGFQAGYAVADGSNNIEIGNTGQPGDSSIIRIGDMAFHSTAFMAGIYGSQVDIGSQVLVDENGQLGTLQSSRRYKEDIEDIGRRSDDLMKLRPVKFRYRQQSKKGAKATQYGLIAEEVAAVFPELVVRNKDGAIETVQYHLLPALLLNDLQRKERVIEEQDQKLKSQQSQLQAVAARLAVLERQQ